MRNNFKKNNKYIEISPEITNTSDRRKNPDRRQPTPMISRYLFRGSRRNNRRKDDKQTKYYVDKPCKKMVFHGFLTIVLGALDALLTYFVLQRGGIEINPLIRFWLSQGWHHCVIYKLSLMSVSAFIIILHQNFLKMRYIIRIINVFYSLLIIYQIFLLIMA